MVYANNLYKSRRINIQNMYDDEEKKEKREINNLLGLVAGTGEEEKIFLISTLILFIGLISLDKIAGSVMFFSSL